jgi:hypothetical protein
MVRRKYTRRVDEVKNNGVSVRHFIGGGESIVLLEGSQASPVRPSDNGAVEVKTLEWLEAAA